MDDWACVVEEYLRDIILNFVIAGRDTTAQTLTWATYLISQHSDVEDKVPAYRGGVSLLVCGVLVALCLFSPSNIFILSRALLLRTYCKRFCVLSC